MRIEPSLKSVLKLIQGSRTVATYQTLNNIDRLKKLDPSRFKLIIVDEAHHAAAPSQVPHPL